MGEMARSVVPPEEVIQKLKGTLLLPMGVCRPLDVQSWDARAGNTVLRQWPRVFTLHDNLRGQSNYTVWDQWGEKPINYTKDQFEAKFQIDQLPEANEHRVRNAAYNFALSVREKTGKPTGLAKDKNGYLRPYQDHGWITHWSGPTHNDSGQIPVNMFEDRFEVMFTPDEFERIYQKQKEDANE